VPVPVLANQAVPMFERGFYPPGFYRTRHRRRCLRRRAVLALAVLGLGLAGFSSFTRPVPLIIYNGSASAPLGFYRVLPVSPIQRGGLVLVKTPESVRTLAAERHYLPFNVDLIKRVVALDGDRVCAFEGIVSINGQAVAKQLEADSKGRPLPRWKGCRTLGTNDVFLLMESVPDSFDSRYFGPVQVSSVVGRLTPLWLR
jgi:conjugative transfer signal peptidase TraF